MKHLVGIGVLVAIAFVLRFWLRTSLGLNVAIRYTYLRAILFWCLTCIIHEVLFSDDFFERETKRDYWRKELELKG